MITPIRHPKLNTDIDYLHSKSGSKSGIRKECVPTSEYKNGQKSITRNQSASVNFTGGFFSPKKPDNVSFSGDFWNNMGQRPAVKNFFRNPKLIRLLEKTGSFALMEAFCIFAISTTIKPVSILAMPGSKKEDKDYNATKSVLAGAIDFGLALAVLYPVDKALKGFADKIKNRQIDLPEKAKYLYDPKHFETFQKTIGYAPKFIMAPFRSMLTIALIPPTLKILFPDAAKHLQNKDKKPVNKISQEPQTNKPNRQITQVSSDKTKVLAGGVKC